MTTTADAHTQQRMKFGRVLPAAYRALSTFHDAAAEALEPGLVDLVCLRTAQINGCPYCLDMHSKDALHHGDTTERLFLLDAWREAPGFTTRERAALALTDAVTLVRETHVPADVWEEAAAELDENELAALTTAIISSNAWNRLLIATREPAGTYRPS